MSADLPSLDTCQLDAQASSIALRIANRRNELDLSVRQVAEHLGLSVQSIYMYEKGEREPSGANLFGLADLLGVSARWLVMGVDDGTAVPVSLPLGLHPVVSESLACLQAYLSTGASSVALVHAAIRLLETSKAP